jgi:hypothetical protein
LLTDFSVQNLDFFSSSDEIYTINVAAAPAGVVNFDYAVDEKSKKVTVTVLFFLLLLLCLSLSVSLSMYWIVFFFFFTIFFLEMSLVVGDDFLVMICMRHVSDTPPGFACASGSY